MSSVSKFGIINRSELLECLSRLPINKRSIVAIAGPPASGKSTLAEDLQGSLSASSQERAQILPMDGYHFDDHLLKELGRLPWKGAPDTFDVAGLRHMLVRLKQEPANDVLVPVFDRDLEIARAGARIISHNAQIIIVEGNYLLCRTPPWSSLSEFFDVSVLLQIPEENLRERILQRWINYGLDQAAIQHKLEGNDLPNGRYVMKHSTTPDWICATI